MTLSLPTFDLSGSSPRHGVVWPGFQTVVADCAWQPKDTLPGPKRGAAKHYNTMSTPDLCALSYRFPKIAPDALLFSWRLASMPFDGLDVCRAWGFEPVSELVWVKTPNIDLSELVKKLSRSALKARPLAIDPKGSFDSAMDGLADAFAVWLDHGVRLSFAEARRVRIMLGHYVRCCHEVCIIAARPGAAARIQAHDIPSVMFAPVGKHSEKPAAFYELVERLAPGPYLELFARQPRGPGWTAIGDQLGTSLDLPLAPSGA